MDHEGKVFLFFLFCCGYCCCSGCRHIWWFGLPRGPFAVRSTHVYPPSPSPVNSPTRCHFTPYPPTFHLICHHSISAPFHGGQPWWSTHSVHLLHKGKSNTILRDPSAHCLPFFCFTVGRKLQLSHCLNAAIIALPPLSDTSPWEDGSSTFWNQWKSVDQLEVCRWIDVQSSICLLDWYHLHFMIKELKIKWVQFYQVHDISRAVILFKHAQWISDPVTLHCVRVFNPWRFF